MRRLRSAPIAARAHCNGRALLVSLAAALLALSGGCHLITGLDDLVVVGEPAGGGGLGGAGSGTAGADGGGGNAPTSTASAGGSAMCGGEVCAVAACCGGGCVEITEAPNCGACGNDCIGGRACEEGPVGAVCGPTWIVSTGATLSARKGASAVWLGDVMFIWGGRGNGPQELKTGGLVDRRMDTWTAINISGAPSKRAFAAAVWTGLRVIVWGGGYWSSQGSEYDGARYELSSDQWLPMNSAGTPSARRSPIAVWTGTEMLIWGGEHGGAPVDGGGRYNEGNDEWASISTMGAPSARSGAAWVWSGTELLLFGGRPGGSGATGEGHAYNPSTDTWRALAPTGAPSARYDAFGLWMNGSFLVVGGRSADGTTLASAAKYDPLTDAWSPVADAPAARAAAGPRTGWTAWNGIYALVQGGVDVTSSARVDGARYHAATNEWTLSAAFASGKQHEWGAAAWTGQELLVWSGLDNGALVDDGERGQP
jgi:hypothetical protein